MRVYRPRRRINPLLVVVVFGLIAITALCVYQKNVNAKAMAPAGKIAKPKPELPSGVVFYTYTQTPPESHGSLYFFSVLCFLIAIFVIPGALKEDEDRKRLNE